MFVQIEFTDNRVAQYDVADVREAKTILDAIANQWIGQHFAVFEYDGGKRVGLVDVRKVQYAGMMDTPTE